MLLVKMSLNLAYAIHVMLGNIPDVQIHTFGISMLCVDALDVLQLCLFSSRYSRRCSGCSVSNFWYCLPSALFIGFMLCSAIFRM